MSCSVLKILFVTHVRFKKRNNIVKVSNTMCASNNSVEVKVDNIGDHVGVFWPFSRKRHLILPIQSLYGT